VLSALALSVPIVSLSYAPKNDVLMATMGMGAFCLPAKSSDVDQLAERFRTLEEQQEQLVEIMRERNRAMDAGVERQREALSTLLTTGAVSATTSSDRAPVER
jgi:polysaccharide pyruvyl transferase WcaK-like protein